jgi:hypothetical protein
MDIPAKTFTLNDPAGSERFKVLVQGVGAMEVKRPAGPNAAKIRGVAVGTRINGDGVSVRTEGEFPIRAASAIAVGDDVNIADTDGRVKTVNEAAGTRVFLVGEALTPATQANDIVIVDLKHMGERFTA